MKKIGPREMREIYLRAAEMCFGYITERETRGAMYGCFAIEAAIVDRLPWVFDDSVHFNQVARNLCGLFVQSFRNEASGWEEKRPLYGEFGPCTHKRTQLHRVTALCLMADCIGEIA